MEPSDLLYLRSEMIMSNSSHRIGSGGRSLSEIIGLSRFQSIGGDDRDRGSRDSTSHTNGTIINCNHEQERERKSQWPHRPQEGR